MDTREVRFVIADSALGRVLVACGARGLRAVMLGEDDGALEAALLARHPGARRDEDDADLDAAAAAVVDLIESPDHGFDWPLDPGGTRFQRRVWDALREIPVGTTATYARVAERIGRPGAVRAVGAACAANPLAVVIPCHRVLRADGGLSGYRWGVERKRLLLEREAAASSVGV